MKHRPFVLLTTLVFAMAACSGSDDDATTATDDQTTEVATTSPATTATTTVPDTTVSATSDAQDSQADVFSFADDDLCGWVTEEEVTEFIAAAFDWNGTVTQTPPDAPKSCEWRLTGTAGESLTIAYDAEQWQAWEGGPFDFAALDVVDFSDEDPRAVDGAWVSGHPALSDGVLVTGDGWGGYAFWVPPREEYLALSVSVPGEELEYPDDRVLEVADQFLNEFGWID
jgi:hypothetical protein